MQLFIGMKFLIESFQGKILTRSNTGADLGASKLTFLLVNETFFDFLLYSELYNPREAQNS